MNSDIASTICKDCQDDNGVCLGDALCGCPHHNEKLQKTSTKRKRAKFCWNCATPKTVWWTSKKKLKCEDNKTHLWVWFK